MFCTCGRGNTALWYTRGESVHSNKGLCKVSQLCIALLKYYRALKLELPLSILSKLGTLRYFIALGHTASDIYAKMMEVYGNSMSYDIVKWWHGKFLNDCMDIVDEPRQEQPNVINKDNDQCSASFLIEENECITFAEINRYFQDVACNPLSHKTIIEVIQIFIGMKKFVWNGSWNCRMKSTNGIKCPLV